MIAGDEQGILRISTVIVGQRWDQRQERAADQKVHQHGRDDQEVGHADLATGVPPGLMLVDNGSVEADLYAR